MGYKAIEIRVPGQVSGPAALTNYILDEVSMVPGKKRPAVIVRPGGAYMRCPDRENEPVIIQFLGIEYHAFLLDYSVTLNRFPTALQELAGVVALLREHSDDWLAGTERIVACGFSTADHLACSLGVFWNQEFVYRPIGRTTREICPSAMLLGCPVITSGEFVRQDSIINLLGEETTESERRKVSLELQVTTDTLKTFLWHAYGDETVPVENSLLLTSALKRNGVNLKLHILPRGGHGASLANEEISGVGDHACMNTPCCQSWIKLAETWLRGI